MSKFRKFWKTAKSVVHLTEDAEGHVLESHVDRDISAEETLMAEREALSETHKDREEEVQKPGTSIHTAEWDRCVADVKAKGGANAYAVCTAQLGEESFKSEYRGLAYTKSELKKARKEVEKMGIEGAGTVPESLLARQDLEGEADRTEEETGDGIAMNAQKNAVDNNKLVKLKDEAKKADTKEQKEELVDRIKQTQEKRQKAALEARGVAKSFSDFWKNLKKDSEYDIARPGQVDMEDPSEFVDEEVEDLEETEVNDKKDE